jgi:hypothetical protein
VTVCHVVAKSTLHNGLMKLIAYARVSASGQTLDAQREQLRADGCDLPFQESMSGACVDRPVLAKALDPAPCTRATDKGNLFCLGS